MIKDNWIEMIVGDSDTGGSCSSTTPRALKPVSLNITESDHRMNTFQSFMRTKALSYNTTRKLWNMWILSFWLATSLYMELQYLHTFPVLLKPKMSSIWTGPVICLQYKIKSCYNSQIIEIDVFLEKGNGTFMANIKSQCMACKHLPELYWHILFYHANIFLKYTTKDSKKYNNLLS